MISRNGFTLVELSIVMIIIGLLIGGVFGGIRLVEIAQISKTIQDLKAIESAALTFRDTYGRLPGDISNPSTRLPNCTAAPCATSGNGDRRLDSGSGWTDSISVAAERFTAWHHIQASGLLAMSYQNITDLEFGVGQPEASLDGGSGFRFSGIVTGTFPHPGNNIRNHLVFATTVPAGPLGAIATLTIPVLTCSKLDRKIDDGMPYRGRLLSYYGGTPGPADLNSVYFGQNDCPTCLCEPAYKLPF